MSLPHWSARLPADACAEAVQWARAQPSAAAAWRSCQRGDWMLWLLGRLSTPGSAQHRRVVLAACDCAATALRYVPADERRPAECLRVTRAWARGRATIEQMREARAAAHAAADAAYAAADAAYAAAASSSAASASASAAAASSSAASAANTAASAAAASSAAAYAAAAVYASARTRAQSRFAALVRRRFPHPPRLP